MSLNYLLPTGAAGLQLKQQTGTIRNSTWKTLATSPETLISLANIITIPISFVLRVTDVTNIGLANPYFIGTPLMQINGDGFMAINNFLSGASPANKDYTFFPQSPAGFGVALGEISDNILQDYTISLYSTADDPGIIIADTPFVLTYIEITF